MKLIKRLKRGIRYCQCGCGTEVKNRFIHGHNNKFKKIMFASHRL